MNESMIPEKQNGAVPRWGVTWQGMLPLIISFLSLMVAVLALIVNYHSTQNTLRPLLHMAIGDSQSPEPYFGLFVRNNGMGPARIKSIEIRFDEKPIARVRDISKAIAEAGFPGRPIDFEILSGLIDNESVLGAGQEVLLFAGSKDQILNPNELEIILERVHAHIIYSSIDGKDYDLWYPNKKDSEK